MNWSSMIMPSLLLRAIIEYLSCIITILLNTIFIIAILRLRTLRTPNNILLANSALNLICACLTFLTSVTIALRYSINHYIDMVLCRIIGYLIYSCCHGIMYSYLLLSINRFLSAFFRSKKHHLSIKLIFCEIIFQWALAFIVPSTSLFLNQIEFQRKPCFCSPRKPFHFTLGIFTGFFIPIISITIFNLIVYFRINKLQTFVHSSIGKKQKYKLNQFFQLSQHLKNHRNEKNIKLLRQFATFSFVFVIGGGFFTFISIFDFNDSVPESIYLITLSFPAISLLIITLMVIKWNKSIKKSIYTLFNIRSRRHYLTSATTVQFSTLHVLNRN